MSKALRIGVDVDDVVADLLTAWLDSYNAEMGTSWTPDDLTQWEIQNDLGCSGNAIFKHLTPSLYDHVKPFDGVKAALQEIEALGHEIWFVTNCKDEPTFKAKVAWLERWELFNPRTRAAVGCWPGGQWPTKNDVPVDWLIDDHIGNCEKFTRGYPVLVTRPHNRNLIWPGKRIKHLRDVIPLLKYAVEVETEGSIYGHASKEAPAVRKFETGATRDTDTGKLDYEAFFSPAVLKRRAEFMHKNRFQSDGSMRAGDNWQKGIPTDAYMKSLARHFMTIWHDYRAGKPLPQEEVCALMFNAEGLLFEDLKTPTP